MTHYLMMYIGGAALGGILAGTAYHFHENMFKKAQEHYNDYVHGSPAINSDRSDKHH